MPFSLSLSLASSSGDGWRKRSRKLERNDSPLETELQCLPRAQFHFGGEGQQKPRTLPSASR
jgi:hypothetical protein